MSRELSDKICGVVYETAINLIIIFCGMVLPMLTIAVRGISAVAMMQLPSEPGTFVFQLMLLALIPISNLVVWKCLEVGEYTAPIKVGLLHGAGLAIATAYTLITGIRFASGHGSLVSAMVAQGSLLAALMLSRRLSKASYRRFVGLAAISSTGALLLVLTVLAISRPW